MTSKPKRKPAPKPKRKRAKRKKAKPVKDRRHEEYAAANWAGLGLHGGFWL